MNEARNQGTDMHMCFQGDFSEPKSMELRALLGPYPADENVWGEGVTLDY